ncbi:MAG: mechanosensitive ion channel family protein [Lachnospira sp.]
MKQLLKIINSPKPIISIIIIISAFILWLIVRKAHRQYMATGAAKGEKTTLVRVFFGVLRLLIIIGTLLIVLQINGVNVTSAIAGLGLMSAIIGLALQDVLKDTIMGIHIISDHFFSVGDVVKYDNIEGVVIGFTMKTTTIRNIYDQTITTICNRNISQITRIPEHAQVDIDLPLSYDENTQRVHRVLQDICARIDCLEGIDSCIYKGTQQFAESAIIYKIRFFCLPEDKPDRTRDVMKVIQNGLDAADIHIPYNQLDIHHITDVSQTPNISQN